MAKACQGCEGRQAQIRTLEMQLGAMEAVLAMQNGGLDEIGRLVSELKGGMVANICRVLERHGVTVDRPQRPLQ